MELDLVVELVVILVVQVGQVGVGALVMLVTLGELVLFFLS